MAISQRRDFHRSSDWRLMHPYVASSARPWPRRDHPPGPSPQTHSGRYESSPLYGYVTKQGGELPASCQVVSSSALDRAAQMVETLAPAAPLGIPGPLSVTENHTRSPSRSAVTRISGSGWSRNFTALEMRFSNTCRRCAEWHATMGQIALHMYPDMFGLEVAVQLLDHLLKRHRWIDSLHTGEGCAHSCQFKNTLHPLSQFSPVFFDQSEPAQRSAVKSVSIGVSQHGGKAFHVFCPLRSCASISARCSSCRRRLWRPLPFSCAA